jgi:hypothetical protein
MLKKHIGKYMVCTLTVRRNCQGVEENVKVRNTQS